MSVQYNVPGPTPYSSAIIPEEMADDTKLSI